MTLRQHAFGNIAIADVLAIMCAFCELRVPYTWLHNWR